MEGAVLGMAMASLPKMSNYLSLGAVVFKMDVFMLTDYLVSFDFLSRLIISIQYAYHS